MKSMKSSHMLVCAAIFVVVLALVAAGSSAIWLVFPLACAAMMFGMMWMMMRPGGKDQP